MRITESKFIKKSSITGLQVLYTFSASTPEVADIHFDGQSMRVEVTDESRKIINEIKDYLEKR